MAKILKIREEVAGNVREDILTEGQVAAQIK
jgi:hypothetical protein